MAGTENILTAYVRNYLESTGMPVGTYFYMRFNIQQDSFLEKLRIGGESMLPSGSPIRAQDFFISVPIDSNIEVDELVEWAITTPGSTVKYNVFFIKDQKVRHFSGPYEIKTGEVKSRRKELKRRHLE